METQNKIISKSFFIFQDIMYSLPLVTPVYYCIAILDQINFRTTHAIFSEITQTSKAKTLFFQKSALQTEKCTSLLDLMNF